MANLSNINNKFLVTTGGNVGIGVTSPGEKLDVGGNIRVRGVSATKQGVIHNSGSYFSLVSTGNTSDTTGARIWLGNNSSANAYYQNASSHYFRDLSSSIKMTLDSSGNVGIGRTPDLKILDLQSTSGLALRFYNSATFKAGIEVVTTAGQMIGASAVNDLAIRSQSNMLFSTGGNTERMRIDSSGVVKISNTGDAILTITSGTTNTAKINFGDSSNDDAGIIAYTNDAGGSDTMAFTVGTSEKMRIINSGNVGIGTNSPNFTLDVEADKDTWISRIYNTGSDANAQSLLIRSDATSAHDASVMGVYADSGYKMVVRSTGNVGIGTTSPSNKLDVFAANNFEGIALTDSDETLWNILKSGSSVNTSYFNMFSEGVTKVRIHADNVSYFNGGNVGIGTTSPSKKLEVAGSYKLGTNAYIQYDAGYPYTINMLNTAAVGNLILNAGAGSSGYESKIELQGSNTTGAAGITLSTGSSPRMVVTADGRVEVAGNVLSIDNVDEYRQDFTTTGSSTPSFDIDLKSIGASGQPFEVFVAWTHYSTAYGAGLHQAYYQRSTVQSDITLIHTYFNQTSTNGGAWSVVWLTGTEIRVQKSAGSHAGTGYGYIRVTRLKP